VAWIFFGSDFFGVEFAYMGKSKMAVRQKMPLW